MTGNDALSALRPGTCSWASDPEGLGPRTNDDRQLRTMLDLRAIEIFLAVCDEGSLSAAARRLDISQAAVSQRLSQLEKEVGASLIDRVSRPMRLLPAGALLRSNGRRLVGEMEDLKHHLMRFREAEMPELRLGILESLALALVPRLVPELRKLVGTLSITSGTTAPLVPDLVHGDLDIILTSERLDEVDEVKTFTMIREPFVLALPKGTPEPREPEDLQRLARKLTFVRYGPRRRIATLIDNQLARYGIQMPRTLEFASSAPVIDLVRQGLAFSILTPLCLYSSRVAPEELTIAPVPAMSFSRQIELASRSEHLLDLPARIADRCWAILESDVAPELRRLVPHDAQRIVVGEI